MIVRFVLLAGVACFLSHHVSCDIRYPPREKSRLYRGLDDFKPAVPSHVGQGGSEDDLPLAGISHRVRRRNPQDTDTDSVELRVRRHFESVEGSVKALLAGRSKRVRRQEDAPPETENQQAEPPPDQPPQDQPPQDPAQMETPPPDQPPQEQPPMPDQQQPPMGGDMTPMPGGDQMTQPGQGPLGERGEGDDDDDDDRPGASRGPGGVTKKKGGGKNNKGKKTTPSRGGAWGGGKLGGKNKVTVDRKGWNKQTLLGAGEFVGSNRDKHLHPSLG